MSKTAKIISSVSVSIVCILAIVLGCLFGIKCTITFDYGYDAPNRAATSGYIADNGVYIPPMSAINNPKSTTITRFTNYAPNRPTRTGYSFDGWYTDSACTIPWNNTKVKEDMTLYAKWKAN